MGRQRIRFRTTRDPRSGLRMPTPASIHVMRRASRHALVRLEALRPALNRRLFSRLHKSLRNLVEVTAESRDAEVQWRLILRLRGEIPHSEQRECNRLLTELGSRKRAATLELAEYLSSGAASGQLRRLNRDLVALEVAQSSADLPRLASRCCRGALQQLRKLLVHKVRLGRHPHRLRIKMRVAIDLMSLSDAMQGKCAARLVHELKKMQDALGDLHDSTLLACWLREHGLTLTPHLRAALDTWVQCCLTRCKRHRKPAHHAIRRFFARQ